MVEAREVEEIRRSAAERGFSICAGRNFNTPDDVAGHFYLCPLAASVHDHRGRGYGSLVELEEELVKWSPVPEDALPDMADKKAVEPAGTGTLVDGLIGVVTGITAISETGEKAKETEKPELADLVDVVLSDEYGGKKVIDVKFAIPREEAQALIDAVGAGLWTIIDPGERGFWRDVAKAMRASREETRKRLDQALQAAEELHAVARETLEAYKISNAKLTEELEAATQMLDKERKAAEGWQRLHDKANSQLKALRASAAKMKDDDDQTIESMSKDGAEYRARHDADTDEIGALRKELMALKKRHADAISDKNRANGEAGDLRAKVEDLTKEVTRARRAEVDAALIEERAEIRAENQARGKLDMLASHQSAALSRFQQQLAKIEKEMEKRIDDLAGRIDVVESDLEHEFVRGLDQPESAAVLTFPNGLNYTLPFRQ